MKEIILKSAIIGLLGLVLANPRPIQAAMVNPIAGLFVGALSAPVIRYNGQLVPAEYRSEPRRTTVRWATAYTSTVDQCDSTPFITANGTKVYDGIVAANWLKFGTRVRIPEYFGDKVFVVTDRMHPRFADRIDVWMDDIEEARRFGIRKLTVEVL
jgi:3D (Asp-Asp-Asp) domain-containing protein